MNCVAPPTLIVKPDTERVVYPDLTEKQYCRGKGYILSQGDLNGRLNFTFTASRDTAYIQFKDLIGRKALFLVLRNGDIEAWDMRNNLRYDQASILLSLPFFELISSGELRSFLWGQIPDVFSDPDLIKSKPKKLSGEIQFQSSQTEFGPLIKKVLFNIEKEKQTIEMVMMDREFDLQYPHLIRDIPSTIVPIKVNS